MSFDPIHEAALPPVGHDGVGVLLVDDQPLVRRGLRTVLELEDDLWVVAEAGDGVEALRLPALNQVDVALVDAQMPRMGGVELIGHLAEQHPTIACVMLTTFDDETLLAEALRSGARGHLLKDVEANELATAVRQAHAGRPVLGHMAADVLLSRYVSGGRGQLGQNTRAALSALSERERVVARHVGRGATNREIARLMFISEGTVKNHVSAILRKLCLRDRTALAIRLNDVGVPVGPDSGGTPPRAASGHPARRPL
ncbi:response regulator [Cellulomonas sp. Y8]|uniref:response regulator n=1 Tax=Cellulomonas sp. Y8 TaxID=2591145 RepID=UPI003D751657